jgi:hypothetical protein
MYSVLFLVHRIEKSAAPVSFKGSGHGATAPELTAGGRPPPFSPWLNRDRRIEI